MVEAFVDTNLQIEQGLADQNRPLCDELHCDHLNQMYQNPITGTRVLRALSRDSQQLQAIKFGKEDVLTDMQMHRFMEHHPHVLPLVECGETKQGLHYKVTPFIQDRQQAWKLDLSKARNLPIAFAGICSAIEWAHQGQNQCLLDLGFPNLLMQESYPTSYPLLYDFGSSRPVGTLLNEFVGTDPYAAFETMPPYHPITFATDVYSVAVMLTELSLFGSRAIQTKSEIPITKLDQVRDAINYIVYWQQSLVDFPELNPVFEELFGSTGKRDFQQLLFDGLSSQPQRIASISEYFENMCACWPEEIGNMALTYYHQCLEQAVVNFENKKIFNSSDTPTQS